MESKPLEFFHALRHPALWCTSETCSVDEIKRLLTLCKGVVDLSWGNLPDPSFLPILAEMNLQRLSLGLKDLFDDSPDLTHPLFRSITHFDICDSAGAEKTTLTQAFDQISALSALTHLALAFDVPRDIALPLLEQCPQLRLLLILWPVWFHELYEQAQIPRAYDVRFVIGLLDDCWKDWEAGAKGFSDSWAQGDDFVARKRNGEIPATRYWLT
ncbi:hypothetical protein FB451DRAFT_735379 [Mycena latifolia]|nr:hypothetical protein FB451DRAFT_735379 [Mycena latifolia]